MFRISASCDDKLTELPNCSNYRHLISNVLGACMNLLDTQGHVTGTRSRRGRDDPTYRRWPHATEHRRQILAGLANFSPLHFRIFFFPGIEAQGTQQRAMLRQFSARLPPRARASCSRLLGQGSRWAPTKRSMATVRVDGIPKVGFLRYLWVILFAVYGLG